MKKKLPQDQLPTLSVQAGERSDFEGAPVFPIWQTATFSFKDFAEIDAFNAGRTSNLRENRLHSKQPSKPNGNSLELSLFTVDNLSRSGEALIYTENTIFRFYRPHKRHNKPYMKLHIPFLKLNMRHIKLHISNLKLDIRRMKLQTSYIKHEIRQMKLHI